MLEARSGSGPTESVVSAKEGVAARVWALSLAAAMAFLHQREGT